MERLQKVIANKGYCSRRNAEVLISDGRVAVNGVIVTELGVKVGPNDEISIDGVKLEGDDKVYFVVNKPRGVISAASDERGRKVVTDLIPVDEVPERIYPIGRLDYDTTGVILLTNDGEFANMMMHPAGEIDKTYIAKVNGVVKPNAIHKLRRGVVLDDGKKTAPAEVYIVSTDKGRDLSTIQITIHEGRYHQVKKMCEAVGYPVKSLRRSQYGCVELGDLPTGGWRRLKPHEVKTLRTMSQAQKGR